VPVAEVTFLPLGADVNTAVYRVVDGDGTPYFLKLRRGPFDEVSVVLTRFLSDWGIAQILAPLSCRTGELWAEMDGFRTILYPFVEGRNGYEVDLSDRQWAEFGAALKRVHTAVLPPDLRSRIQRETYASQGRDDVRAVLDQLDHASVDEPVAIQLVAFLKAKRREVLDLAETADRLAQSLRDRPLEATLCHSDVHAGNLLLCADGALCIVDWDAPILAPKERDLMSIGAGLMGNWRPPDEEERLFYGGYGEAEIDLQALAYYRFERIIQDIAAFCEQLLSSDGGGNDRIQALRYLTSNFLPGHTIDLAYRALAHDPQNGGSASQQARC
jgi:spectinomycin phosphotransferase